jgi:allantoin racemase
MRLLVINPNTTSAMTEKVVAAASHLCPDVVCVAATGRFGPAYIASRAAFAIAGHAALDAYAAHHMGCDAVLLACFGDPGLDALREVASVPVIGLVEASARAACAGGRRFSIVTGGVLWEPMLRESLALRGLAQHLASIRTVAPDGGTIARDPEGALDVLTAACDACVEQDGAEAIILGGAGLIGLAGQIAARRPYPVICSVLAGLNEVVQASKVETQAHLARKEGLALPVTSSGLSPELAALLLQRNI